MQPPGLFVDGIDGAIVTDLFGRHDVVDLVVQNPGATLMVHHQHGVHELQVQILEHDDPHGLVGPAESPQRHELRNRVVLAIAVLLHELKRRCPVVGHAPVRRVQDVAVAVHLSVDRAQLSQRILTPLVVEKGLPLVENALTDLAGADLAGADLAGNAALGQAGFLEIALQSAAPLREHRDVVRAGLPGSEQRRIGRGLGQARQARPREREAGRQGRREEPTSAAAARTAVMRLS